MKNAFNIAVITLHYCITYLGGPLCFASSSSSLSSLSTVKNWSFRT